MNKMQNKFSLYDKKVLVSGATGYLGRAMVYGLAELGATVLVNGRSEEHVKKLSQQLTKNGLTAIPAVFDINDQDSVRSWFSDNCITQLNGLVNNAYSGNAGSLATATEDDYRNSYEIGLVSAHRLLQQALPSLRTAVHYCGQASVVNIGSVYGVVSPDQRIYENTNAVNPPFYGAAKAALLQWTRYAACELGNEGIRVNAISPGPFPSEDVQETNPYFTATLASKVPMGRIGQAEELQGPLSFLISDASSFVNGANLMVDGGWTCW